MSQQNKQNCFQKLENDSPVMIKNREILSQKTRPQMKTSPFQNATNDFVVRRINGALKSVFHLDDSTGDVLLKAESELSLIGTTFRISSSSQYLGMLTSNFSGSLWTLQNKDKQKIMEVSFKDKVGNGPQTRNIEVEFLDADNQRLKTKQAIWDAEKKIFKLKFSMNELVSSVNNFILQKDEQDVVEFGKIEDGRYKLKANKNIEIMGVFSVVVSALSFKWICV